LFESGENYGGMADLLKLEGLEVVNGCMFYRPTGEVTLERVTELAIEAIAYAREHNIHKLVYNTTGLSGYAPPTIMQRYDAVERCARVAMGKVHVALVTRHERMDDLKFHEAVGFNRGLSTNVFLTEWEALQWLAERRCG
jgi:hypothetical protein